MKHKLTASSLLLVGIVTLAPTTSAATTWYVNGVNGSDINNCMSSTTACKTIGHAVSLASSGDSIMVAAATYTENLTISKSLTILGSSAPTTIIDGGGVNTVVKISNSAARVTLSQLTIRHGNAQNGGGIYNSGTLTINHCVVSGNRAGSSQHLPAAGGGIYSAGILTINNCVVSGNIASGGIGGGAGGGIVGGSLTTINNSTISGNSAGGGMGLPPGGAGGGIVGGSVLTINNSTISGNSDGLGRSGGIAPGNATTINNSTISGNRYGGIGGSLGLTTINNTTISGNSDGCLHSCNLGQIEGNATLQNSIVANSVGGGNCYGNVTSRGYNMSSDNTCNFHSIGDRNNKNPMLGTLGNYGGPTQTIPLLSGSPAIDAGNPSGCTDGNGHLLTTDQRGMPRPDHEDTGGCDMGAYEKQTD
jgi:hypothetical protein